MAKIVTYAMFANVFLLGMEFFTAFYSNIPGHMHPFHYLYAGIDGHNKLVPLMWVSSIFALTSLALLVFPGIRKNEKILAFACSILFISLWIDKGFGLVIGGFVPNMFEGITEYWPTLPEAYNYGRCMGDRLAGSDRTLQGSNFREGRQHKIGFYFQKLDIIKQACQGI